MRDTKSGEQVKEGPDEPKPEYAHTWDQNSASCSGVKEVMVPTRHGDAPYSVRCDDRSHVHPVLECVSPSGQRRTFEFFKAAGWKLDPQHQDAGSPGYGHKHPWHAPRGDGEIFLGLSYLWPESEFRAERVEVIQARYGRPLQRRPPEPPPPVEPPPGFQKFPSEPLAAPPRAERELLRTWTEPKDDKPATGPAAPDDGWGDGSDIPF